MFSVLSGRPVNTHTIALVFSIAPDFGVPATSNPANYTVTGPGTPVVRLVRQIDGNVHLLLQEPLVEGSYTVEVGPSVEALGGNLPDPSLDTVQANGIAYPLQVRYLTSTSIQVMFGKAVIQNSALTLTSNYSVLGPLGALVPISVTPVGVDQVTLRFGSPLPEGLFRVEVSGLTTTSSLPFEGKVSAEVTAPRKRISVALSQFSGEVRAPKPAGPLTKEEHRIVESVSLVVERARLLDYEVTPHALRDSFFLEEGLSVTGGWHMVGMALQQGGTERAVSVTDAVPLRAQLTSNAHPNSDPIVQVVGSESYQIVEALSLTPESGQPLTADQRSLFGTPEGLVFFSPSLANVANSTIQVDEVSTCTQAYDSYVFPEQEEAARPLYTYSPLKSLTRVGSDVLLRGSATRSGGAVLELAVTEQDQVESAVDLDASFLLVETYPPARASLLSNSGWATFTTGIVPPKYVFKTLDNSSPLPPPVVGGGIFFVNPSYEWSLTESLTLLHTMSVGVGEGMTSTEGYDLNPGENVVQANVSETLTLTEGAISPLVGVNLGQSLVLSESLVLA